MRTFRSSSSQVLVTAALACFLLLSGSAQAQTAGPTKAESEFDQQLQMAAAHYEQGRYQDSILALQNAYELQPLPRLLCNIGQAYRKLGNHRAAVAQYDLCLKSDPEIDPTYRAEVESYIAERRQTWAAKSRAGATESPKAGSGTPPVDKGAVTQPCSSPTAQTPVYKKWWLWTIVGVVVAGGAVGLGVGLTQRQAAPMPTPFIEVKWQ